MFNEHFSHFLSFGATDQQTVIALADQIDGLLVPGTIAAFQRDGTGGFVLSLSAATSSLKYLIDPRFPLFQQKLETPKRSHELLAELLGAPELVQTQADPRPEDFSPTLISTVTQSWVDFNLAYSSTANSKFDKYAKRLGEEPKVEDARPPDAILAPYLISNGEGDAWWELSKQLFDGTVRAGGDTANCVRVIAASSPGTLEAHALSVPDANLVIWVSGLDEMRSGALELAQYAKTIRRMSAASKRSFALYGGFFAVILQNLGLGGASHGIGFGEYRDWVELPQSGMPPARYYVPQIHRYLQNTECFISE